MDATTMQQKMNSEVAELTPQREVFHDAEKAKQNRPQKHQNMGLKSDSFEDQHNYFHWRDDRTDGERRRWAAGCADGPLTECRQRIGAATEVSGAPAPYSDNCFL